MKKTNYIEKDWFMLSRQMMARPSVIIGGSGSGKTETSLKLAYLDASVNNADIIYIDAKGDDELAPRFVAAMHQAGKQRITVFPVSPYYGWVGDARALYNRLMA